ncbi:MAG: ABC transporter permease [Candidatus Nealsonbacteria bacterium]|nr:ABC transporter permease [Candidatus Nealsonbacteria bacterium]
MIKLVPYLLKSLWRHRTRTLLTLSGTAVGLFVFCIVGSVGEGLDTLLGQLESQQSLIVFQAHKVCTATSRLPQDYSETIAQVPGVRDVVPIRVFTNNCRASLDSVVFYGVPPEKVRTARDFKLLEGSLKEFEAHQDAALVGRAVAARRSISIGKKFSLGEHTVVVAGIYACASNAAEESYIYTHLDFLQRGRGDNQVGTVTQLEVLLEPGQDADKQSRAIDDALRGGSVETETRSKGAFQAKSLADLTELLGLIRYLGYACVGVVLMLVTTTTVMAVQDRIREHAVLQTLGFSTGRVFALVLAESTIIGTLGGVLGVGLAMGLLTYMPLAIAADAVAVAFTPSLDLALLGLGLGVSIGLLAGIFPGWKAATAEIVPALQ